MRQRFFTATHNRHPIVNTNSLDLATRKAAKNTKPIKDKPIPPTRYKATGTELKERQYQKWLKQRDKKPWMY